MWQTGSMSRRRDERDAAAAPDDLYCADDVDEAASKVWELGGKLRIPPTDIPEHRRFCCDQRPTGAISH